MAIEWLHPRSRCFFYSLFCFTQKGHHLCLLVPQTPALWIYARAFVCNLSTWLYVSKARLQTGESRGPVPSAFPHRGMQSVNTSWTCSLKLRAHKCRRSELYLCIIYIGLYLNSICSWSALIWFAKLYWIINNTPWEQGLQQGNVKGTKILNLMVPNTEKEIVPPGPHPKVIHKDKRVQANIEAKGLAVPRTQINICGTNIFYYNI